MQLSATEYYTVGVDLGSNTLRIAVLLCASGHTVYTDEMIVRTADGLTAGGKVSDEAVKRIIHGVKSFLVPLRGYTFTLRAVTTEALRRASNAEIVLDKISQHTGISFEIISGAEEAELTLLAVSQRLLWLGGRSESLVVIDIGGGSTELTLKYGDQVLTESFPLGIVTLTQESADRDEMQQILKQRLLAVQKFWQRSISRYGKPLQFVATAGTPTTVAAMKLGMDYASYDSSRINGTVLHRCDLAVQQERLLAMSVEKRRETAGEGREDLIISGIMIFDAIYGLLGMESAVVVDDGLREGVALALCQQQEER